MNVCAVCEFGVQFKVSPKPLGALPWVVCCLICIPDYSYILHSME